MRNDRLAALACLLAAPALAAWGSEPAQREPAPAAPAASKEPSKAAPMPAAPASAAASAPKEAKDEKPAKELSLAEQIKAALAGGGSAVIAVTPKSERDAKPGKATPAGARVPAREAADPSKWAYEGKWGPQAWGSMSPAYAACAKGKRQSPVDLRSIDALGGPADDIGFLYKPARAEVLDTGKGFKVLFADGPSIEARGVAYKLQEIQIHTPGEGSLEGKSYPMTVHLLHRSSDGRVAVVSAQVREGAPNAALDAIIRHLPLEAGDRSGAGAEGVDASALLPPAGSRGYFQFIGSATTPPCEEGALWLALKEPAQASREQLALLSRFYPNVSRPSQPLNGRLVREQR